MCIDGFMAFDSHERDGTVCLHSQSGWQLEGGVKSLSLTTDNIMHTSDYFCTCSTDEGTDSHSTQLWALDQILLHIRQRRVPRHSSSCLSKTVRTVLLCSLFKTPTTPEKSLPSEMTYCLPKAPLSSSLQLAVSKRFTSILSDLSGLSLQWCSKNESCTNESTVGQRSNEACRGQRSAIPGVMEDGGYFLTTLLEFAHEKLSSEAGYTLLQEFTDEVIIMRCVFENSVRYVVLKFT